ncbi:hypothetical protein JVT61DRAFT_9019 [Boletus reticuloceps]|uniref:Uncharacterized protein n=1 Tax=Boletus reticuloceps TaxID=495285 RepID=A0A8I2YHH9_9AGAM|nr:hypothetical protein JVT61DRAFT_9019 [Boletus reticuloceps]
MQAVELLVAIYMVSFNESHRAALSNYQIAYNKLFWFQSVISIGTQDTRLCGLRCTSGDVSMEEEGIWGASDFHGAH